MTGKYTLLLLILAGMIVWVSGCTAAGETEPEPTQMELPTGDTSTETSEPLPPVAAIEAQRALADQLGISTGEVSIISTEQREWSDACLGLGQADEGCAQVMTPGWLVILEANGQQYEAHTDDLGGNIRFADNTAIPIEPETLPLLTQPAPATEFEEALLTGTLEYDMNGCWRVASEGSSFLIIWPYGFTATGMIGAPQVLDTEGNVVGTAGMPINLGGGAREAEAAEEYEAQHTDLPDDQCSGPYWVVGEIVQP